MRKLTLIAAILCFTLQSFAQGTGKAGNIATSKTMTNAVSDTSAIPYAVIGKHVVMSAYVDTLTGTAGGTVNFEQYITSTGNWFIVSSQTITAVDKTYGWNFGFIPYGNCRIRTAMTGTQTAKLTTTYGFK